MKKGWSSFTLVELLTVAALLAILGSLALAGCARLLEEVRAQHCKSICESLGCAIRSYSVNNDDYLPFSWGPGGVRPDETWAAKAGYPAKGQASYAAPVLENDSMTSIGCLYPDYVPDARLFRCPSALYDPSTLPALLANGTPPNESNGWTQYRWRNRQYTLVNSNYGYDCRVGRVPANHAIFADMDGSYQGNHRTKTQNHTGGQFVLFMDHHVSWQPTNFCSNDPKDNIFAKDNWDADTDSCVMDPIVMNMIGYAHKRDIPSHIGIWIALLVGIAAAIAAALLRTAASRRPRAPHETAPKERNAGTHAR